MLHWRRSGAPPTDAASCCLYSNSSFSPRMATKERHFTGHTAIINGEGENAKRVFQRLVDRPRYMSVPPASRGIGHLRSYRLNIAGCINSVLCRGSACDNQSLLEEQSEAGSGFITAGSSLPSSSDSFCGSPKSDEYMSACSGGCGSVESVSPQLIRCSPGRLGLFSEKSVRLGVSHLSGGAEERRQFSAPGDLCTAGASGHSREVRLLSSGNHSLPYTSSVLRPPSGIPAVSHLQQPRAERAEVPVDAHLADAKANASSSRCSVGLKQWEARDVSRALSDQADLRDGLETAGFIPSGRQFSGPSTFTLPFSCQHAAFHQKAQEEKTGVSGAAERVLEPVALPTSPSPNGSENFHSCSFSMVESVDREAPMHTPLQETPPLFALVAVDRAQGEKAIAVTSAAQRSKSWAPVFPVGWHRHSPTKTRSAERLPLLPALRKDTREEWNRPAKIELSVSNQQHGCREILAPSNEPQTTPPSETDKLEVASDRHHVGSNICSRSSSCRINRCSSGNSRCRSRCSCDRSSCSCKLCGSSCSQRSSRSSCWMRSSNCSRCSSSSCDSNCSRCSSCSCDSNCRASGCKTPTSAQQCTLVDATETATVCQMKTYQAPDISGQNGDSNSRGRIAHSDDVGKVDREGSGSITIFEAGSGSMTIFEQGSESMTIFELGSESFCKEISYSNSMGDVRQDEDSLIGMTPFKSCGSFKTELEGGSYEKTQGFLRTEEVSPEAVAESSVGGGHASARLNSGDLTLSPKDDVETVEAEEGPERTGDKEEAHGADSELHQQIDSGVAERANSEAHDATTDSQEFCSAPAAQIASAFIHVQDVTGKSTSAAGTAELQFDIGKGLQQEDQAAPAACSETKRTARGSKSSCGILATFFERKPRKKQGTKLNSAQDDQQDSHPPAPVLSDVDGGLSGALAGASEQSSQQSLQETQQLLSLYALPQPCHRDSDHFGDAEDSALEEQLSSDTTEQRRAFISEPETLPFSAMPPELEHQGILPCSQQACFGETPDFPKAVDPCFSNLSKALQISSKLVFSCLTEMEADNLQDAIKISVEQQHPCEARGPKEASLSKSPLFSTSVLPQDPRWKDPRRQTSHTEVVSCPKTQETRQSSLPIAFQTLNISTRATRNEEDSGNFQDADESTTEEQAASDVVRPQGISFPEPPTCLLSPRLESQASQGCSRQLSHAEELERMKKQNSGQITEESSCAHPAPFEVDSDSFQDAAENSVEEHDHQTMGPENAFLSQTSMVPSWVTPLEPQQQDFRNSSRQVSCGDGRQSSPLESLQMPTIGACHAQSEAGGDKVNVVESVAEGRAAAEAVKARNLSAEPLAPPLFFISVMPQPRTWRGYSRQVSIGEEGSKNQRRRHSSAVTIAQWRRMFAEPKGSRRFSRQTSHGKHLDPQEAQEHRQSSLPDAFLFWSFSGSDGIAKADNDCFQDVSDNAFEFQEFDDAIPSESATSLSCYTNHQAKLEDSSGSNRQNVGGKQVADPTRLGFCQTNLLKPQQLLSLPQQQQIQGSRGCSREAFNGAPLDGQLHIPEMVDAARLNDESGGVSDAGNNGSGNYRQSSYAANTEDSGSGTRAGSVHGGSHNGRNSNGNGSNDSVRGSSGSDSSSGESVRGSSDTTSRNSDNASTLSTDFVSFETWSSCREFGSIISCTTNGSGVLREGGGEGNAPPICVSAARTEIPPACTVNEERRDSPAVTDESQLKPFQVGTSHGYKHSESLPQDTQCDKQTGEEKVTSASSSSLSSLDIRAAAIPPLSTAPPAEGVRPSPISGFAAALSSWAQMVFAPRPHTVEGNASTTVQQELQGKTNRADSERTEAEHSSRHEGPPVQMSCLSVCGFPPSTGHPRRTAVQSHPPGPAEAPREHLRETPVAEREGLSRILERCISGRDQRATASDQGDSQAPSGKLAGDFSSSGDPGLPEGRAEELTETCAEAEHQGRKSAVEDDEAYEDSFHVSCSSSEESNVPREGTSRSSGVETLGDTTDVKEVNESHFSSVRLSREGSESPVSSESRNPETSQSSPSSRDADFGIFRDSRLSEKPKIYGQLASELSRSEIVQRSVDSLATLQSSSDPTDADSGILRNVMPYSERPETFGRTASQSSHAENVERSVAGLEVEKHFISAVRSSSRESKQQDEGISEFHSEAAPKRSTDLKKGYTDLAWSSMHSFVEGNKKDSGIERGVDRDAALRANDQRDKRQHSNPSLTVSHPALQQESRFREKLFAGLGPPEKPADRTSAEHLRERFTQEQLKAETKHLQFGDQPPVLTSSLVTMASETALPVTGTFNPTTDHLMHLDLATANRIVDGTLRFALHKPRTTQARPDTRPCQRGAKMELRLGEAARGGPSKITDPVPEAPTAYPLLEKSCTSVSSQRAAVKRLALQRPALTCSLPPIFCGSCMSDSSLWNLQLRRRYSPADKLVSTPSDVRATKEDLHRGAAVQRKHLGSSQAKAVCGSPRESTQKERERQAVKLRQWTSLESSLTEVLGAPSAALRAPPRGLPKVKETGRAISADSASLLARKKTGEPPLHKMPKPRRPWACGEPVSASKEESKTAFRTYVHKPGCSCPLCLPLWGASGSSGLFRDNPIQSHGQGYLSNEASSPRLQGGLPVVPLQPGCYAAAPPVRIVSSPVSPHPGFRVSTGNAPQYESSANIPYNSHGGAVAPSSYYNDQANGVTVSTPHQDYSQQQMHSPHVQTVGSNWGSSHQPYAADRMSVPPATGFPVIAEGSQQEGGETYGTPAFAQSPISHTMLNAAVPSEGPPSAVISRCVSSEELEQIRIQQQQQQQQQQELKSRQEELEKQQLKQRQELEKERQLWKEERENLEKQRKAFEQEKHDILQARLQATPRATNKRNEPSFDAGVATIEALPIGNTQGPHELLRPATPRRQPGPPHRHTSSTSNIVRSITGLGVGDMQSGFRKGRAAAEADGFEEKEASVTTGGRQQHLQHPCPSNRFFSRSPSVDTTDDKETTASPQEDLHSDPSMALSTALDKIVKLRMKLETLQQQLEVQSHEVSNYYNSLKAAQQVHSSLQQTAADCRVCYGRRHTQLQEVDKRLSVLTAQELHPCSIEELEELAQELEGTQYKLTVVQAQRAGGAVEESRKKPKQLLPYSSSCLPEPKSSFAIPEEPVARIGPDECVAMHESALQEIRGLAEDLEHIKTVHIQYKKAYKRLQGLMSQEVNSFDVDLQKLVAIEKNLEDKLRRLLFLNGDANYAELSDAQMQEYFRVVNLSIRKVYREIALRESGGSRQHEPRSSGLSLRPSCEQAKPRRSSHDNGYNADRGKRTQSTNSANRSGTPRCNTHGGNLLPTAHPPKNTRSISSTCSSIHIPFIAGSKAGSIATQHMLMQDGRSLPCKTSYEHAAPPKVLGTPRHEVKKMASGGPDLE